MENVVFDFTNRSIKLNKQQSEIVKYEPCTNIRVLASAGSGKTTTITARIAYLIKEHKIREDSIFLTTFSRNASDTMKERIDSLIGQTRVYAGTFHALASRILKDHQPESLKELYHVDELPHKFLAFLISEKGRRWVGRLHYLIIDEFQDINETQYEIIRRLHHPGSYLTIVGDDAQNIYTWRGSCVDYILDFHRKFRNVQDFQLSINYRSTEAIVAVANSIMRHIPTLPHKERMTATTTGGEKPEVRYFYRSSDERNYIHYKILEIWEKTPNASIAILSKFNSVLFSYEEMLIKENIPVTLLSEEPSNEPKVVLCTLHSAKGLEWDHVFFVRLNDDSFPQKKDEESILQERRLFYVGVTRARVTLTLSYSRGEQNLSRFVREIHRPLLTWFSATQYRLSSSEFEGKTRSLRGAIDSLQGEDFRYLKEHDDALPAFIKNKDYEEVLRPTNLFPIGESWRLPEWVLQKDLKSEWEQFIKTYILRLIGVKRPESAGAVDQVASDVVWTIKISAEDALFFEENRPVIEKLVRFLFPLAGSPLHTPPQVNYQDIMEALPLVCPNINWDHTSLIHIVQIIHKIRTTLYNLRYVNYRMDLLRFSTIPYSPPQEMRCDLIRAWYTSNNLSIKTKEMCSELFLLGGTHIVRQGRNAYFYRQPSKENWIQVKGFLDSLEKEIVSPWVNSATDILARIQYEDEEITTTADLVIDKTLILFQQGSSGLDMRRLEIILELLETVHLMRKKGHLIESAVLFQPLSGLWMELDIKLWSGEILDSYIRSKLH